ncbi:MAG: hypothetical protein AAB131_17845, partial [Actinomycetota bacterium]
MDYSIDPAARLLHTVVTDGNGHSRETFNDLLGRTRRVVEHPNSALATTTYDYLATGELTRITDTAGNRTIIEHDLRGLWTKLNNPDTGEITQRYDLAGNLVERTEPNHRAAGPHGILFDYTRNRLDKIRYPGTKPEVRYTYGNPGASDHRAGRIVSITDETGTQERFYGALGEVTQTVRTIHGRDHRELRFATQFRYDSLGRLLQLTYPDGEVLTHTYDAGGLLASAAGRSTTYISQLTYDVFGNRTRAHFGNGVESAWSYDPRMVRLATATTRLPPDRRHPSDALIQDLVYQYDAVGNPQAIFSQLPEPEPGDHRLPGPGRWNLTYDGVDRLVT